MVGKKLATKKTGTFQLTSLSAEDARSVLIRLFEKHEAWRPEIEAMASEVLANLRFQDVLAEVERALERVDEDAIFAKSGRKHGGYLEPEEAAANLIADCLEPFLKRLKMLSKSKTDHNGLALAEGIVAALYNLSRRDDYNELEVCMDEICGDSAHWAVRLWLAGGDEEQASARIGQSGRVWSDEFSKKFVPDWKWLVEGESKDGF